MSKFNEIDQDNLVGKTITKVEVIGATCWLLPYNVATPIDCVLLCFSDGTKAAISLEWAEYSKEYPEDTGACLVITDGSDFDGL